GPTALATAPLNTAPPRCHTGFATTTNTDHTARSTDYRRSAAFTTSVGSTTSRPRSKLPIRLCATTLPLLPSAPGTDHELPPTYGPCNSIVPVTRLRGNPRGRLVTHSARNSGVPRPVPGTGPGLNA